MLLRSSRPTLKPKSHREPGYFLQRTRQKLLLPLRKKKKKRTKKKRTKNLMLWMETNHQWCSTSVESPPSLDRWVVILETCQPREEMPRLKLQHQWPLNLVLLLQMVWTLAKSGISCPSRFYGCELLYYSTIMYIYGVPGSSIKAKTLQPRLQNRIQYIAARQDFCREHQKYAHARLLFV